MEMALTGSRQLKLDLAIRNVVARPLLHIELRKFTFFVNHKPSAAVLDVVFCDTEDLLWHNCSVSVRCVDASLASALFGVRHPGYVDHNSIDSTIETSRVDHLRESIPFSAIQPEAAMR